MTDSVKVGAVISAVISACEMRRIVYFREPDKAELLRRLEELRDTWCRRDDEKALCDLVAAMYKEQR